MKVMIKAFHVLIFCPFLALFLAGCGTVPTGKGDPGQSVSGVADEGLSREQTVERRFNEYWGALLSEDFEKAYAYLSPATRQGLTVESFRSGFSRIKYKNAEFKEVKCEEDICLVRFILTYDYGAVKDIPTWTGEKWFFLDGSAWVNFSN